MSATISQQPGIPINEILKNIIGYSTLINTPFGQKCALYADHTATGRPFQLIEDIISQKIKPMLANSHTETSLMGYFSTQMLHYAEESILKSFKVSKQTHFAIPTGNGATGAFERLTKILRISDITQQALWQKNALGIPFVYITPYEHHSNILSWQISGCKLQKVQSDNYGNMNIDDMKKQLIENQSQKIQIVSVSATSNVTSQRTNLNKINEVIKEYRTNYLKEGHKIFFIVDAAAFCSHNRLNLSQNGLSEVDFVCISPHKHLGGAEATGILISRLASYDNTQPPSFPGGGTVKAVVGLDIDQTWYHDDPFSREMPGTPNAVGFYRAALTFELQDKIGLEYILEKEEHNAKYFYKRIQEINQEFKKQEYIPPRDILIYGDPDIEIRYDVFSFNIYGPGTNTDSKGKSLFHPNYVARLLNDIFGIQVRSGCSCAGPYGVLLLGIPEKKASEIVGELLQGYEDVKPGWVRLDTFFSFEKYEIDYIVEAIKCIGMWGEKLQRFYEIDPSTGQWSLRNNSHPQFNFELDEVMNNIILQAKLEERQEYFKNQLEMGKELMQNPEEYIKKNFPNLNVFVKNNNASNISIDSLSNNSPERVNSIFSKKEQKQLNIFNNNVLKPLDKNVDDSNLNNIGNSKNQQEIDEFFSNREFRMMNMIASLIKQEINKSNNENTNYNKYMNNNYQQNNQMNDQQYLQDYKLKKSQEYYVGQQKQAEKKNNYYRYQNKYLNNSNGNEIISERKYLSKKSIDLQQLFKNYNQNNTVSLLGCIQLCQDFNLSQKYNFTVQELTKVYEQISGHIDLSEQGLNFEQFNQFIESLAIYVNRNNKKLIGVYQKIKAFFDELNTIQNDNSHNSSETEFFLPKIPINKSQQLININQLPNLKKNNSEITQPFKYLTNQKGKRIINNDNQKEYLINGRRENKNTINYIQK